MTTTLLLNPRKRGKRRASRKAPSAAQRAARAAFARAAKSGAFRRGGRKSKRRAARSNPAPRRAVAHRRSHRRVRRNPIAIRGGMGGLLNFRSYVAPLKDAAVMGAGAVAMDMLYGYAQPYLPAMLQRKPGTVGLGDLVKALLTVAAGRALSRVTGGLSQRAALGALVVQARDVALTFLPTPVASAPAAVHGLPSPAMVAGIGNPYVRGNLRRSFTGTQGGGVAQFIPGRANSPLLSTRPAGVGQFVSSGAALMPGRR